MGAAAAGRAGLSYRRAEETSELATRALANPAAGGELGDVPGWTLHQVRHSLLTHETAPSAEVVVVDRP